MTPEETRQAAQVMLAHAEGKRIEWREANDELDEWVLCTDPLWDWDAWQYRVAPERWSGKIWVRGKSVCSIEDASAHAYMQTDGWRLIEAKEVDP